MSLTHDEKAGFVRDGIAVRRGLVPENLITRAKSLIDDWVREQMDASQISAYTQRTFAPELGQHPDLLDLFANSGAVELATELLGDIQPVTTTQIQIRIPEETLTTSQPEKAMHVDGVACPHLDPDELRTFSLLVGVVLSDISDPDGGALRYLPGGHHTMARWFGTEWSLGVTEQVPPQIDTESGTPFLGKPGDVLLMHHLVPHSVGNNYTSTPRVMAYFRVSHPHHAQRRLEALRDPWLDYRPLAAITITSPTA
ncbi:phytanoyl-CoA dioxygenase family protein [Streptomyces sp. BK205]|uniref:phytanoyl-CoA dioxygenase family protein n=1 Tax=Streptomyces sp. BK205 TaxID=2512164 RepID=UPI001053F660|nr:phytanoyl-CoA dioxygenase family protein [Streptomyces sp. BK205]TCR22903.1 phytanoyl-CoA dioxygenase PhyH [Streptomyces sp. BK205]